jgi:hypothetical protein
MFSRTRQLWNLATSLILREPLMSPEWIKFPNTSIDQEITGQRRPRSHHQGIVFALGYVYTIPDSFPYSDVKNTYRSVPFRYAIFRGIIATERCCFADSLSFWKLYIPYRIGAFSCCYGKCVYSSYNTTRLCRASEVSFYFKSPEKLPIIRSIQYYYWNVLYHSDTHGWFRRDMFCCVDFYMNAL